MNIDTLTKRHEKLTIHINNVRRLCYALGDKLTEEGECDLGLQLMANAHLHDNSKFRGIEWDFLHEECKNKHEHGLAFLLALNHHRCTNLHHPEAWSGGIHGMPQVYLAEMVCDWFARSNEFDNKVEDWIKNKATLKYNMEVGDKTYRQIECYMKMLLQEVE